MRSIEVVYRHQDIIEESLSGKIAVIIDVLRATTVLITALKNGAQSVKAIGAIEDALAYKENHPEVLLGGERNAAKIPGFQLGNSPLEMTEKAISGKELVICTTNGSQSVGKASQAPIMIAASLVNAQAVTNFLLSEKLPITIICSGTNGNYSSDDYWASGLLVSRLIEQQNFYLTDGAQMALSFYQHQKDPFLALKDCFHLNWLIQHNYQDDVDFCLQLDIFNIVPKYQQGCFKL